MVAKYSSSHINCLIGDEVTTWYSYIGSRPMAIDEYINMTSKVSCSTFSDTMLDFNQQVGKYNVPLFLYVGQDVSPLWKLQQ